MALSMTISNTHEHDIQTCSVITWSDCGSENVKSTHPVGQLWTIKYHMLYAAMCASTTSTAGRKRHALNDQNGLAVTAVAVILSLNPGVAGSHFTLLLM